MWNDITLAIRNEVSTKKRSVRLAFLVLFNFFVSQLELSKAFLGLALLLASQLLSEVLQLLNAGRYPTKCIEQCNHLVP